MKCIKLILLITLTSCQDNTKRQVENEYAFDNIDHYNTESINSNHNNYSNKLNQIKNKDSVKKLAQNSKIEDLKSDSLKQIINYNNDIRKKLKEYYRTARYLPSAKFNHLKHLRKYSKIEQIDGITNKPKFFIDYIIEKYLESPDHKKYLTDRKLLKRLRNDMCDDGYVSIKDTLENGQSISIEIRSSKFNTNNRKINIDKKHNYISEIDGKYPFGATYYNNSIEEIIELSQLEIVIAGNGLETNMEEFNNLFNPNFCSFGMHKRIAEAYQDGNNIYIYLFGGSNAGSYFSKLIFDINKGYIGKIVADYVPLSMYGSFHENFIGY